MLYNISLSLNHIAVQIDCCSIAQLSAYADYLYDNGIAVVEITYIRALKIGRIKIYERRSLLDSTMEVIKQHLNKYIYEKS